LSGILRAAGTSLEKVVRATVFLKNMGDFAAMNEVFGTYFNTTPPARSTVEVARLPKDVLVEIDVIALALERKARCLARPEAEFGPIAGLARYPGSPEDV